MADLTVTYHQPKANTPVARDHRIDLTASSRKISDSNGPPPGVSCRTTWRAGSENRPG
ncbi:hypothetical protein [Tabrizicola sp.]|uniref:hypothetical protein n=1 Tax=Tabrizicola sp. TaxID=2005166 RepID=UPI00286C4741|nr:hypothetical protein [Tabrizicola sp.]